MMQIDKLSDRTLKAHKSFTKIDKDLEPAKLNNYTATKKHDTLK